MQTIVQALARMQGLKMIDAIHAAAAIKGGCGYLLTHDRQIDRPASGIEVVNIDAWLAPPLQKK